jgi:hypothetical protein
MKLKRASALAVAVLAFGSLSGIAQAAQPESVPAAKYTNCKQLNKKYPYGVAHPKARVKAGSKYVWDKRSDGKKYKHRPSVINADLFNSLYKSFDRDKDNIKCEVAR